MIPIIEISPLHKNPSPFGNPQETFETQTLRNKSPLVSHFSLLEFGNRSWKCLNECNFTLHVTPKLRESFCESGEGVRLPRERGWPPGKFGELPGKFGELPGKFGKLPGNPGIAVKFHIERTSGEVAENFRGSRRELPGKSGDFPEARGSLTPYQRLAKFVSKKRCNLCVLGALGKQIPSDTKLLLTKNYSEIIIFGNYESHA